MIQEEKSETEPESGPFAPEPAAMALQSAGRVIPQMGSAQNTQQVIN